MNPLQKDIAELERQLELKKRELQTRFNNCNHRWGETVADHIYRDSYTIPGDPPGTMGIDWRGPCYVPAKTTHRWKRTCLNCGKEEYTQNTNKTTIETPRF